MPRLLQSQSELIFSYVVIARKFVRSFCTAGGFNLFFCAICGASVDNFAAPAEKEAASPNKLPRLQFYLVNLFCLTWAVLLPGKAVIKQLLLNHCLLV